MVKFSATIQKFSSHGEKTGWSYINVPKKIAEEILPGKRNSFRVKGYLDSCAISQVALIPIGEGNFIMALNAQMRKNINKSKGDKLVVKLEADLSPQVYNSLLMDCLEDDEEAKAFFNSLAPGHRRYFSVWIEQAKMENTRVERVARAINALAKKWDYGKMMREGGSNVEG